MFIRVVAGEEHEEAMADDAPMAETAVTEGVAKGVKE
jgi:hypothetical protein